MRALPALAFLGAIATFAAGLLLLAASTDDISTIGFAGGAVTAIAFIALGEVYWRGTRVRLSAARGRKPTAIGARGAMAATARAAAGQGLNLVGGPLAAAIGVGASVRNLYRARQSAEGFALALVREVMASFSPGPVVVLALGSIVAIGVFGEGLSVVLDHGFRPQQAFFAMAAVYTSWGLARRRATPWIERQVVALQLGTVEWLMILATLVIGGFLGLVLFGPRR